MDALSRWLLDHYGKEQYTPGLERMNRVLAPLKSKLQRSTIVTIAGTNGKGETTLRLSQHLSDKTHCTWTSPHIERVTERFRSEAGEIGEAELRGLIESCHEECKRHGHQLTYYEFLFYVFCTWAATRSPEVLLLEVGLGGRLDAVNALDAAIVLLPSISRDHQEYLGPRYDGILREKLGVLRKGSLLLAGLDLVYLKERAMIHARSVGAEMRDLDPFMSAQNFSHRNQLLAYAANAAVRGEEISLEGWRPTDSPLEHRGEVLTSGATTFHFFGSHNVDGVRKLIQFLATRTYNLPRTSDDVVLMAFSQRTVHDLQVMLRMVKSAGLPRLVVTWFNHPKAASRELMEGLADQEGLEFVESVDSFVQGTNRGNVVVAGSYYFLGHVKSLLRGR